MVSSRVLVWDKIALKHLKEIYDYYKNQNNLDFAVEIKNTILKTAEDLISNPYLYEQDRFKIENDDSFRAFEKLGYRISYKIAENQIRILRLRHTSREPVKY